MVVEVRGEECSLEQVAATLRAVAEMIEQGRKGGEFPIGNAGDVLWERECQEYGGFRMGNRSLIHDAYYGGGKAPNVLDEGEFSVASINRQDLIDFGYDPSNLSDDDMQTIASRMGKAYHEGYCECWGEDLRSAADHYDVPCHDDDEDLEDVRLTDSQAKELGYK